MILKKYIAVILLITLTITTVFSQDNLSNKEEQSMIGILKSSDIFLKFSDHKIPTIAT